ncbi:dihydrodipicolinate synthase family protein [Nonomuraea dietziae]|uniref:dihydrodipicolinate synthase family protein n=1 Tax=Nonomuraea dietziae TaxID=65515 RepID=UPI0031D81D13
MSTAIDTRAARLRDRLRGALVAAAATPMTRSGEVDLDLAESYFHRLVASGADALAVLAHTGRGPFLSADVRRGLIVRARRAGVPVVVGVGGSGGAAPNAVHARSAATPSGREAPAGATAAEGTGVERTVADAMTAAELGADGLLLFPSEGDRVALHDAVWRAAGLPMIAFDLYTSPCPPAASMRRDPRHHPVVAGS